MTTEHPTVAEKEEQLQVLFERFPKCDDFNQIFNYLRSLDVSPDVAAECSCKLLWQSHRGPGRPPGKHGNKFDTDIFLTLFSPLAGASFSGLMGEAQEQLGLSKATFARHLSEQVKEGTVIKTSSGLYKLAVKGEAK